MGEPEEEKEQTCCGCPHLWKPETGQFAIFICHDLAPPPPLSSPPLSRKHWQTELERQFLTGEGWGMGEEPSHTRARKSGPL